MCSRSARPCASAWRTLNVTLSAWLACLLTSALLGCSGAPPATPPAPPGPGADPPEAFPAGTDLTWPQIRPEFRADVLVSPGARDQVELARRQPVLGSCWPMEQGGIGRRYLGAATPSPVEKYAQLFLPEPAQAAELREWIAKNHGPGAAASLEGGGICQGWAAASVSEDAPAGEVLVRRAGRGARTYLLPCRAADASRPLSGCVRVTPGDILALAAEAYAGAPAFVIGARCTDSQVRYGAQGRAQANNCQTDAGLFFLVLGNYIGRYRQALILTLETKPVWQRPLHGYQIQIYEAIDAVTAAALTGDQIDKGSQGFRHVKLLLLLGEVSDTSPGSPGLLRKEQELVLELDSGGKVRAGHWVGASRDDHPGIAYLPEGPGPTAPGLTYRNVRALIDASRSYR